MNRRLRALLSLVIAAAALAAVGPAAASTTRPGNVGRAARTAAVAGGTNAVSIAAGGTHSCLATALGYVWCWGSNRHGELGAPTPGRTSASPVLVYDGSTPLRGVTSVAAGYDFNCALLGADPAIGGSAAVAGTVRCWGAGGVGQLGNGAAHDSTSPVAARDLTGVTSISAGRAHACAVGAGGLVSCWGANGFGQLALGSVSQAQLTTTASAPDDVTADEAGNVYALDSTTGYVTSFSADGRFRWRRYVQTLADQPPSFGGLAVHVDPVSGAGVVVAFALDTTAGTGIVWPGVLDAQTGGRISFPSDVDVADAIGGAGFDSAGNLFVALVRHGISSKIYRYAGPFTTPDALSLGTPTTAVVPASVGEVSDLVVQAAPGSSTLDRVYVVGAGAGRIVGNASWGTTPHVMWFAAGDLSVLGGTGVLNTGAGANANACVPTDTSPVRTTLTMIAPPIFSGQPETWLVIYSALVVTGNDAAPRLGRGLAGADAADGFGSVWVGGRWMAQTRFDTITFPFYPSTGHTTPADSDVPAPQPLATGAWGTQKAYSPAYYDSCVVAEQAKPQTDPTTPGLVLDGFSASVDGTVVHDVDQTPDGDLISYDSGVRDSGATATATSLAPAQLHRFNGLNQREWWWGTIGFSAIPLQSPFTAFGTFIYDRAKRVHLGGDTTCVEWFDSPNICYGADAAGQFGAGGTDGVTAGYSAAPNVATSWTSAFPLVDGAPGGGLAAVGPNHICTARADGVWCRGSDEYHQLTGAGGAAPPGFGVATRSLASVALGVSASATGTCAILDSLNVRCFGADDVGQLGDDPADCPSAHAVIFPGPPTCTLLNGVIQLASGPTQIASGTSHTCAIRQGQALCWGGDQDGQAGVAGAASVPYAHAILLGGGTLAADPVADVDQGVTVVYGTPVTGVVPGAFTVKDGTTNLRVVSISCVGLGLTAVNCAAGPVTRTRVVVAAHFEAGHSYTIGVNASGAITGGGVPLDALSVAFRGPTRIAPGRVDYIVQAWPKVTRSGALGGSVIVENAVGAVAGYWYTGSGALAWVTEQGPNQGRAAVSVDGRPAVTFDNWAAKTKQQVARSLGTFAAGRHYVRIDVLAPGNHASPASGPAGLVTIDAFTVQGVAKATPTLLYNWAPLKDPAAQGGWQIRSQLAGANCVLQFAGTGVTVTTAQGTMEGDATVSVDGGAPVTVHGAASSAGHQTTTISGLPPGEHTLRIVVVGSGGLTSGQFVSLSGIEVL